MGDRRSVKREAGRGERERESGRGGRENIVAMRVGISSGSNVIATAKGPER